MNSDVLKKVNKESALRLITAAICVVFVYYAIKGFVNIIQYYSMPGFTSAFLFLCFLPFLSYLFALFVVI